MNDLSKFPPKATSFFQFASSHFVAVSAAITTTVACIVIVFMYSYLSVFDSSLIWLLESADIIKLCLIGFAIISGMIFSIIGMITMIQSFEKGTRSSRIFVATTFFLIFFVSLVHDIYSDIYLDSKNIEYHIYLYISFIFVVAFVAGIDLLVRSVIFQWDVGLINSIEFGAIVIVAFVFVGRAYGLWVRDISKETHTIIVREYGGYLNDIVDSKFIFITSHHTVVSSGTNIIVLQSSDVAQIVSNGRSKIDFGNTQKKYNNVLRNLLPY